MLNFDGLFQNFGLGNEYAQIYSTLLEEGKLKIIDIAKSTGLPRTSCYEYIPKLIELGLILETKQGKSRYYSVSSPAALLKLAYNRKTDLDFGLKNLESNFSAIEEIYKSRYGGTGLQQISEVTSILRLATALSKEKGLKVICSGKWQRTLPQNLKRDYMAVLSKVKNKSEAKEIAPEAWMLFVTPLGAMFAFANLTRAYVLSNEYFFHALEAFRNS